MSKERDISQETEQKAPQVVDNLHEELSDGVAEQAREVTDSNEEEQEHEHEEEQEHEHGESHHNDQHDIPDYSNFDKAQLLQALEELVDGSDHQHQDKAIKSLKHAFDEVKAQERKEALDDFVAKGGEEADFDYKYDDPTHKFDSLYKQYKDERTRYFQEAEKQKDKNLEAKNELLERLRHLVDGEESNASIAALKEIQNQWKALGQVPRPFVKSLWANYNALMDRFYDNRSIYFELKELDRKKNLEAKLEVCKRAEKLDAHPSLKDAIKELNDLHEEYKHIGPVPQAEQEALWQRFKAASDKVYAKRKDYLDQMKGELQANADAKRQIGDEAQDYAAFTSDRINDWNKKTQELLALQKRWEAIGGLPRESAREINKHFWGAFKAFFSNKNTFFKSLEEHREANLKLKETLVEKAEALKESNDWVATSNELKKLQEQWKEIGPVPEKQRESVYKKFKTACDAFFNNRRQKNKHVEKEYQQNLEQKEAIIKEMEAMAAAKTGSIEDLEAFQQQYSAIGFVPRDAIKKIQERYNEAVNKLIEALGGGDKDEQKKMKFSVQLNNLKNSPNASKKIYQKESALRKEISNLENDIALWKNNLEFFAASKTAEKLRKEFDEKIEKAQDDIQRLKEQLKMVIKL